MTPLRSRALFAGLSAAGGLLLLAAACRPAEGPYPSREIRLVVHAAPGGISDAVSRHLARAMQAALGVPVVCENRPGAAGTVALSYVARTAPDGYTIGYAPVDLAIIHHLGYADVTPAQFEFLAMHTKAPATIAVRSDAPWRTLDEFLGAARQARRPPNVATSGAGSIWHLASLAFGRAADVRLNNVPFPGSGPAVTALLGGHVAAVVAGAPEVQPHIAAGSLRALGVMAHARSPILPDVPTVRERGFDVAIDAWGGFLAPKGVPADRLATLAAAARGAIESDDFRRFCRERGLELAPLAGPEFAAFVDQEYVAFGELLREAWP